MIRRTAALLAMLSFALAWIVGVWVGSPPHARLQAALLGLAAGAIAGAGIGVALQKIVLARLSEQWRALDSKPAAPAAPAATRTAGKAPIAAAGAKTSAAPSVAATAAAAAANENSKPAAAVAARPRLLEEIVQ